ncbi:MAG: sensory box histidine kinase [Bacteroidota bacterium]|nr:sensory box histidine kinase [Bacteroidota bacterium]
MKPVYNNEQKEETAQEALIRKLELKIQQQEQEIQQTGFLLDKLFTNMGEVFFSVDMNPLHLTHISSSCEKVYGYTAEEFKDNPELWREVSFPEDRETVDANFAKLLKGETMVSRHRIIHKDKSIRWLETTKTPTLDKKGKLIRIDGVNREVTEQENAGKLINEGHQALAFSEGKFKMFFDNSVDGLMIAKPDGTFREVNQALCDMLGYSHHELLQLTRQQITVEDTSLKEALKTRWEEGRFRGVLKMIRKDGAIIETEISSAFFKDKTGETFSYVSFKDITQKLLAERSINNSEANLNALINSTTDSIFAIEKSGRIIAMNKAFYDRSLEYLGIRFKVGDDLFHSNAGQAMQARWHKHVELAFRGIHFRIEESLVFEGQTYYSEISFTPIKQGEEITGMVCFSRDITGKKLNEEKLKNSEKRFRALIENSNDVISLNNADGSIQYMSPSARAVLGYDPEKMVGKNPFENVHPDDMPRLVTLFKNVMQQAGNSATAEWRQKHSNGGWIWMEGTATNLLHDPAVNAIVDNFRDISERKIAEQKLEKAANELSQIFNSVEEGLFSMDMVRQQYLQVSAGCEKIYGYSIADFFANPRLWYQVVHPEDKTILDKVDMDLHDSKNVEVQFRIIHKNKSVRWVEVKIIPTLNELRILLRIDGIVKDITARKEAEEKLQHSEQRFRALIEKGGDGILIIIDKKIAYVSPSIKTVMGYEPAEMIGRSPYPYIDPKDEKGVLDLISTIRETPGKSVLFQTRWKHKDGTWRWLDCSVTNQMTVEGVNGMVSTFRDITDRKHAEDELQALNQVLEKKVVERTTQLNDANKALESFSYSVAHDLQAPLRILKGYANILKTEHDNELNSEGQRLLSVIMNYAGIMSQLISDLLNFSQVTRMSISISPVDNNKLVNEVIETVRQTYPDMKARIKLNELSTSNCDANLVRQVWFNLISNAVKYSRKKDDPFVEIGVKDQDGKAVYYVKDNGVGFNMEHEHKLFEVFHRLHKQSEFEGSGIGLALAASIVAKHGGRIWAVGKANEGAVFYFTLS